VLDKTFDNGKFFSFPLARVGMQSRRASVAACKRDAGASLLDSTLARGNQKNVEPVLPELVYTDKNKYKSMIYDDITAIRVVEAVKELKVQKDALNTIICEEHPEEAICQ
jgi:hypothetical protein